MTPSLRNTSFVDLEYLIYIRSLKILSFQSVQFEQKESHHFLNQHTFDIDLLLTRVQRFHQHSVFTVVP